MLVPKVTQKLLSCTLMYSELQMMRWEVQFIAPWKFGLPAVCGGHFNPYISVSCRLFVRWASFVSA